MSVYGHKQVLPSFLMILKFLIAGIAGKITSKQLYLAKCAKTWNGLKIKHLWYGLFYVD